MRVEPDALVFGGPAGERRLASKHAQVATTIRGPLWLGPRAIVLRSARPKVLSLEDGSSRLLAPPAELLEPLAATEDGSCIAASVYQGPLFWGRPGAWDGEHEAAPQADDGLSADPAR